MHAGQLHFPHCGGHFKIDDSLSGQQVACPRCASVVAIPDLAPPVIAGQPPPPAPPEMASVPFESEFAFQFGCPVCGGVFQVTREMGGQEISCPHCYRAVLMPEFAPAPGVEPLPEFPPSETHAIDASMDNLLPTGAAVSVNPSIGQPPGAEQRKETFELPSKPFERQDRRAFLEPSAELDDLLPPGARLPIAAEPSHASEVDELPPAVDRKKLQQTNDDNWKRTAGSQPLQRSGVAADGSVLIPSESGYIALREPVKTVKTRRGEVELRRLSPEEKERRRFRRNLIVWGLGLVFLIATMIALAYFQGA
jgi:hypothetical protein